MRKRTLLALSLGTLVALLASIGPARPQSTAPASSPGVKLTFYPADDGAAGVDARVARLIALAVPEGAPASPAHSETSPVAVSRRSAPASDGAKT